MLDAGVIFSGGSKSEIKVLRKVRLPSYTGKGYFDLELLDLKHEVFGHLIRLTDSSDTPTPIYVPLAHFTACTEKAIELGSEIPIQIPGYNGKYMVDHSLVAENDLEEDKPLIMLSIVDGSTSKPILISQQSLKHRLAKLLEIANAPAPASA